eukprot:2846818-Rhodomonas_salina.2
MQQKRSMTQEQQPGSIAPTRFRNGEETSLVKGQYYHTSEAVAAYKAAYNRQYNYQDLYCTGFDPSQKLIRFDL